MTDLALHRPAPRRIGTIQYLRATITAALTRREPQHEGATADWHPLTELPPAAVDLNPAVAEAVTGEVLRTVEDELGRWVPDLYDLEPARLFDVVLHGTDAGAPFRTGAAA